MKTQMTSLLVVALTATISTAQDAHDQGSMHDCPMMMNADHAKGVDSRGDKGMGFSHEKTTHHFRLYSDGGAIEVTANETTDETSRNQIRMHDRL